MRLKDRVAFITGAHRGMGRAIAVRLASEGADIITIDIGDRIASVPSPLASASDMQETIRLVEALGRSISTATGDVRSQADLKAALAGGFDRFGRLDIVVANAGIFPIQFEGADELQAFRDSVDVNLGGVWNTIKASVPFLEKGTSDRSITIINSTAGLRGVSDGWGGYDGYVAAKHGAMGLMRSYANILGPSRIRVNSVHPSNVKTTMVLNDVNQALRKNKSSYPSNLLPDSVLEPEDIANAVLWLSSSEARFVTGVALPVDAGFSARR